MINDKRYYDAFKRISKGIENGGYVEWRRMIEKEFSDYEYSHKINVMKRCELNLGILQLGGSTTLGDYISKCIAIASIFVAAIATVYASVRSIELLNGILYISSMLVIINVVGYLIDMMLQIHHQRKIVYYQEVVKIFQEMMKANDKKERDSTSIEGGNNIDSSNISMPILQNNVKDKHFMKIRKGQEDNGII